MNDAQSAAFGLGHVVEVLGPPELRAQMVKVARAVLARYSTVDEDAFSAPALASLVGAPAEAPGEAPATPHEPAPAEVAAAEVAAAEIAATTA
jgi:hypothetical protein